MKFSFNLKKHSVTYSIKICFISKITSPNASSVGGFQAIQSLGAVSYVFDALC